MDTILAIICFLCHIFIRFYFLLVLLLLLFLLLLLLLLLLFSLCSVRKGAGVRGEGYDIQLIQKQDWKLVRQMLERLGWDWPPYIFLFIVLLVWLIDFQMYAIQRVFGLQLWNLSVFLIWTCAYSCLDHKIRFILISSCHFGLGLWQSLDTCVLYVF